jgi:hypothetical protein
MGRHHDQVGFFYRSPLHNDFGRVAFNQQVSDGKAFKFEPERLVQLFLAPSDRRSEHIHDVKHYDLRMKMVGQCRSLANHTQRGVREINWQNNLLNIHHRAPAGESVCARIIFLRTVPPSFGVHAILLKPCSGTFRSVGQSDLSTKAGTKLAFSILLATGQGQDSETSLGETVM